MRSSNIILPVGLLRVGNVVLVMGLWDLASEMIRSRDRILDFSFDDPEQTANHGPISWN
ncbi:hypothetical protein BJY01DRAFT_165238 [Aspergillus pseudoustus]|uniref:Uncharacterized protein n=1 Tax=Aspergillus pseudoustus TaxID=1810923 RepID=A0ABR4I9M9_9EURO